MTASDQDFGLTFCICTSGRPAELERCLASITGGTRQPRAVIVSDDSAEPGVAKQVQDICGRYEFVTYVEGPRRGLCANRNHVIRQATTSHVSLIDDDGVVGEGFVERAMAVVAAMQGMVISGGVLEHGCDRRPLSNPTFLGHFGRALKPGDRLANVHLNCNVFPRQAFDAASFDESIAYGYEDTDLCAQLLAAGYEIVYEPELVNEHHPPNRPEMKAARRWQAERARFYVTVRRHGRWRRNLAALLVFVTVAPLHLGAHAVKRREWRLIFVGFPWVVQDLIALVRRPDGTSTAGERGFTRQVALQQS